MSAQPLHNRRVVITRAEAQADGLSEQLRALGAIPLLHPAIAFAPPEDRQPLEHAIQSLDQYDWLLLTSTNGVQALFSSMNEVGVPVAALGMVKIGVVGPATAAALAEHGLTAQIVPSKHVAEALLEELGEVAGARVLLPVANLARDVLANGLRERGAKVDTVVAYRTVPGPGGKTLAPLLRAGTIDAVTFTSSSTVRFLLQGLEQAGMSPEQARAGLNATGIFCIGPVTARTARESGLRIAAEAEESTANGLIDALLGWFQPKKSIATESTA